MRPPTAPPRVAGPRLPRMPPLFDYQFFNVARLTEIYEKEANAITAAAARDAAAAAATAAGKGGGPNAAAAAAAAGEPQPLTEEEEAERERLLNEGFTQWSRRDFQVRPSEYPAPLLTETFFQ